MTEQQLYDTLEKCGRSGYIIVRMRIGYDFDNEWEYLNEILTYNPNAEYNDDPVFLWEDDWDEGQQRVEILDYIFVDDLWSGIYPQPAEERRQYHRAGSDEWYFPY